VLTNSPRLPATATPGVIASRTCAGPRGPATPRTAAWPSPAWAPGQPGLTSLMPFSARHGRDDHRRTTQSVRRTSWPAPRTLAGPARDASSLRRRPQAQLLCRAGEVQIPPDRTGTGQGWGRRNPPGPVPAGGPISLAAPTAPPPELARSCGSAPLQRFRRRAGRSCSVGGTVHVYAKSAGLVQSRPRVWRSCCPRVRRQPVKSLIFHRG
jgi:hypothetical protein